MMISAFEKYAILKEQLGPQIRLEVDRTGGWSVAGQMIAILTTEGPRTWVPSPTRDWTSAIEYAFHILAQCPISTDLGETWYTFDAESYLKSRGQKIPWVVYRVAQGEKSEEISEKTEPKTVPSVCMGMAERVATEGEPNAPV